MLQSARADAGRDRTPMAIGHITPFLHVGTPSWDVGEATIAGDPSTVAERILEGTAAGVNQLQVRFRARSCDELCDQLVAFATTVMPLLEDCG